MQQCDVMNPNEKKQGHICSSKRSGWFRILYHLDVHVRYLAIGLHQIDRGVIIYFLMAIPRNLGSKLQGVCRTWNTTRDCWGGCKEAYTQTAQAPRSSKISERPCHVRCPCVSGWSQLCHHQCIQLRIKQLEEKQKAACHTRACDYCHSLLLLPFILSNSFRDEVEEHRSHHQGDLVVKLDVNPSEKRIGVTKRWYTLFCQTTPGKTAAEINILRSLSLSHRK